MNIRLHANATTTPRIRAYIQQSKRSTAELARQLNISESTVRSWRQRDFVHDRSHTPHRLQTTLTPAQEAVVVELRKTLRLPLGDLLVVTREFINEAVSQSGLHRCLVRHGVGKLSDLDTVETAGEEKPAKTFKDYEPGFIHVDIKYLPQMPDESCRRYLFVAIDRATRWVYLEIRAHKTKKAAVGFLKNLLKRCPVKIQKLLTDNDGAFTDRMNQPDRRASGRHDFDQLCAKHGIEHRLIKPRHPQTNGMVERFNGRIADVLKTHRFDSRWDLETTLKRYVWLYNEHIPQKNIRYRTPLQALKDWRKSHPHLFVRRVRNHPGTDTWG